MESQTFGGRHSKKQEAFGEFAGCETPFFLFISAIHTHSCNTTIHTYVYVYLYTRASLNRFWLSIRSKYGSKAEVRTYEAYEFAREQTRTQPLEQHAEDRQTLGADAAWPMLRWCFSELLL